MTSLIQIIEKALVGKTVKASFLPKQPVFRVESVDLIYGEVCLVSTAEYGSQIVAIDVAGDEIIILD